MPKHYIQFKPDDDVSKWVNSVDRGKRGAFINQVLKRAFLDSLPVISDSKFYISNPSGERIEFDAKLGDNCYYLTIKPDTHD